MKDTELSRRTLLRFVGVGAAATAAGGLVSACSLVGGSNDTTSAGQVTIKVALVPDPAGASEFYRSQFDLFEKQNPNIKIQVIENPTDQQVTAVGLAFQQGDGPDVFRAQDAVGFGTLFDKGWVAALDKYVTKDFIARFPAGTLDPATSGLHRDGKLYTLPLVWGQWSFVRLLLVNNTSAKLGGVTAAPKTWEELEQAAGAITKAGGGKTFGFGGIWSKGGMAKMLQNTAGPGSLDSGVDFRTGRAGISEPSVGGAVDLIKRMHNAKIMTPGWETWTDAAQAHTAFAKGDLAMFIASPYQVAEARKLNPDLDMTIATVPVPAAGRGGYSGQSSSYSPLWSMSAQSKHPDEAWKVMDFLASAEFHLAYYEKFGTLTALESAWKAKANPDQKGIIDAAAASVRLIPNPTLASKGGSALMSAINGNLDLQWSQIAQPAILHNSDFGAPAADLNTKLDAFIDDQVKALAAKGVTASRADLTFAGWDPLKPYNASAK